VAGQKRRKSGMFSPQELQQQADRAWTREAAKAARVAAQERARQDRETARDEEIAAGHAEAEAVTRVLQAQLTELETLLVTALEKNPHIAFEQFKEPLDLPEFRPPPELAMPGARPEEDEFLPHPPSGLSALAPGRKRAYAAAVEEGRAVYARALTQYGQAEQGRLEHLDWARVEHERLIARERERVRQQHESVDGWAADFASGRRKAVADYFREILVMQDHPSGFPTGVKVAYLPAKQQIIADIDLPLLDVLPEMASCEYLPTKRVLRQKPVGVQARNALYQSIISQLALRTVRTIFAADQSGLAQTVACNGYVDAINTATGQPVYWCLVSLKVTQEEFGQLPGLALCGDPRRPGGIRLPLPGLPDHLARPHPHPWPGWH
jgi:restriction system protein